MRCNDTGCSAPGEADYEHRHMLDDGEVYQLRRGTKYSGAHYFRVILANDDRPRTMHAEAERTAREQRHPIVAALLERNEQRRGARQNTWRQNTWRQHTAAEHSAERSRDRGYGLEL